jgi:hypothetical protein
MPTNVGADQKNESEGAASNCESHHPPPNRGERRSYLERATEEVRPTYPAAKERDANNSNRDVGTPDQSDLFAIAPPEGFDRN